MTAATTPTERLPSGRRSRATRSRDDVTQHQRARMLTAMTAAVAESGYSAVTVTAVIARAGVSRSTFYEQFTDRQECFLAAFDSAVEMLIADLQRGASEQRDRGSLSALVGAYLDAMIRHEALARVLLIDIATLGPEGVLRRAASQRRISAGLAGVVGARTAEDLFASDALVGAVGSMVTVRLAQGDLAGISELHEPILALARRLFPS